MMQFEKMYLNEVCFLNRRCIDGVSSSEWKVYLLLKNARVPLHLFKETNCRTLCYLNCTAQWASDALFWDCKVALCGNNAVL